MAPKRQSTTVVETIQVKYIGNQPIAWLPSPCTSETADSTPPRIATSLRNDRIKLEESSSGSSPSTNAELKNAFIAYLRREIDRLKGDVEDPNVEYVQQCPCRTANEILERWAILVAALDPSSQLRFLSINQFKMYQAEQNTRSSAEEYFSFVLAGNFQKLKIILDAWSADSKNKAQRVAASAREDAGGREELDEHDEQDTPAKREKQRKGKESATSTTARSPADSEAQRDVPKWYGGRCMLTGVIFPEGAHIVPVRALQYTRPIEMWDMLRSLWPLPEIDGLVVEGHEATNVVPLCPTAQTFWDRYQFALRPIEDPTDPRHRIYVQMVWLKDVTRTDGLVSGNWDYDASGGFADFRRGQDGSYPPVRHGDIYEITTADPDNRPLPSLRMLQIQFGAQKLMAGIHAAGVLRDIFSGDPPDDFGPPTYHVDVPPIWASLLEAATEAGVLDDTSAALWAKAFTRESIRHQLLWKSTVVPGLTDEQALDYRDD